MTIRHHLSDSLLIAYAAGTLPEAFSLVVATHVSLCDECRAALGAFEAVGGAVLDRTEAVAMTDGSLDATLARLTGPAASEPARQPAARPAPRGTLPAPLHDYVGGGLDRVRWRLIGLGVRQAILPTGGGGTARLLHIPAGQSVPDHGHRGLELTLVLQGAFRDSADRFGPGDVEIATEALEHSPVAETGADCICLAATDARLRFNKLIPRLAQPFLRI